MTKRPDLFGDAANPARPKPGTVLAQIDDIADPGAIVRDFRVGDALFSVLLTRQGQTVRAFFNICPHARYPLDRPDGRVVVQDGAYVVCAAHGASFRLGDGKCVAGPGLGDALRALPITLSGADILASADQN